MKALEAIARELREHGDQYLNAPDLGAAVHRLSERTGVQIDWEQLESLLKSLGMSTDLKPSDKGSIKTALERASRQAPPGAIDNLIRQVKK